MTLKKSVVFIIMYFNYIIKLYPVINRYEKQDLYIFQKKYTASYLNIT